MGTRLMKPQFVKPSQYIQQFALESLGAKLLSCRHLSARF
jgi:hypothetical protein